MNIGIIGTGYVGLVPGVTLAASGSQVTCVDTDIAKIERLSKGEYPISEPGLVELLQANISNGSQRFSSDLKSESQNFEVVFISVGTPSAADGSIDISVVKSVAMELASCIKVPTVLVKSGGNPDWIAVASNPAFLREGSAVSD